MLKNDKPPRSKQPPHVALLVETSLGSGRDILRGIARYVRTQRPWSLFHMPGALVNDIPEWLNNWKGDGIIARITTPGTAELLKKTGLPVVDVLGMVSGTSFPVVHVDDAAISRFAFEHLVSRGMRNFAFVGFAASEDSQGRDWSDLRRQAFCGLAQAFGSPATVMATTREELNAMPWEKRQNQLAAWLRKLPKPIGLMVCSDQRGLEVLEACQRSKIHVPHDIAVVGVDNDRPLCDVCNPPLSSVWPNHTRVGYEAAAVLDRILRGQAPPAEPLFIPPMRVVTRQSSNIVATEDLILAAAIKTIREKACTGITINEIARLAGTSRSVLERRFRSILNQTVHDYLIATRIEKAIDLISTTKMPLGVIAETCGFNHQEYMGVAFRQRLGRTPSQYRSI